MDGGDITVDEMSLSDCFHHTDHNVRNLDRYNMTNWRQKVRYVTQYKVDIPGTVSFTLNSFCAFALWRFTLLVSCHNSSFSTNSHVILSLVLPRSSHTRKLYRLLASPHLQMSISSHSQCNIWKNGDLG